ncbi:MAG: hypothetical protein M3081_14245 [Gemmatimonadota bacterium]|nr:hypothetical protein [Gemmatimonadota bacterium]
MNQRDPADLGAVYAELKRITGPDPAGTHGSGGFALPRNTAHFLRVARSLPDGAGMAALREALRTSPPPPE